MKKIFSRAGLLFLAAATMGMLGVSYAGYTDSLKVDTELSAGSMSFEFMDSGKDRDFIIGIQESGKEKVTKLDAKINYDGKTLTITDMDPIDMSFLKNGKLQILIRYIVEVTEEESVLRAASIIEKDQRSYLGEIPFQLISSTPLWSIEGKSASWGLGDGDLGGVPQVIYELLPQTLANFRASHTLWFNEKKDRMEGTILLEQIDIPKLLSIKKVELSAFGLPDDILKEMAAEKKLNLTMVGSYGFEIPLVLDQFNAEGEGLL